MTEAEEIQALNAEYMRLMHAIQSGVALRLERDPRLFTPKHMRVGIDSALVNDSAIAELLIEKGIITHVEYVRSMVRAVRKEKERVEAEFGVKFA